MQLMLRPELKLSYRDQQRCKPFGTAAPLSRRRPASPLRSAVTTSLISVLKDELKYEREYYRKDELLLEDPPGDFQVDNPPGKNSFFLLKVHHGLTHCQPPGQRACTHWRMHACMHALAAMQSSSRMFA